MNKQGSLQSAQQPGESVQKTIQINKQEIGRWIYNVMSVYSLQQFQTLLKQANILQSLCQLKQLVQENKKRFYFIQQNCTDKQLPHIVKGYFYGIRYKVRDQETGEDKTEQILKEGKKAQQLREAKQLEGYSSTQEYQSANDGSKINIQSQQFFVCLEVDDDYFEETDITSTINSTLLFNRFLAFIFQVLQGKDYGKLHKDLEKDQTILKKLLDQHSNLLTDKSSSTTIQPEQHKLKKSAKEFIEESDESEQDDKVTIKNDFSYDDKHLKNKKRSFGSAFPQEKKHLQGETEASKSKKLRH